MSLLTFANPSPPGSPGKWGTRWKALSFWRIVQTTPPPPTPLYSQDLPLAWRPLPMSPLSSPGLAWCYGHPVGAHPPVCHLPQLSSVCRLMSLFSPPEPGRFACHCAACCSVLSLLSHFAVTGAFWGFPASVLYTALCEPHHPFSLCLGSFQKWGDQLWCSWSQSDIRRGTGPYVSFLVTWASVWLYWLSNAEALGAQRRNKVIGASWAPR